MKRIYVSIVTMFILAINAYAADIPVEKKEDSPLVTTTRPVSVSCWQTGLDSLPDWYHPCYGPAITNIKYFDLDPYWVNSRSATFQEVYEELEPLCAPSEVCHLGRIPRELRKFCTITRTVDGREQRYNPFLNWCDNVSMGGGCAALCVGTGLILSGTTTVSILEAGL